MFLLLVVQYFLLFFVTLLMLSCGVDVGFPSKIVISLVFFQYILLYNCLFSPIQGIPSFILRNSSNHRIFNIYFELLYENFTRSRDCDVTFKWRLTVNFLRNNHSVSEYRIFTLSFLLISSVLLCSLFQSNIVYCITIKF